LADRYDREYSDEKLDAADFSIGRFFLENILIYDL